MLSMVYIVIMTNFVRGNNHKSIFRNTFTESKIVSNYLYHGINLNILLKNSLSVGWLQSK